YENMPQYRKYEFTIDTQIEKEFTLNFRIPEWIVSEAAIFVNQELYGKTTDNESFYSIHRKWRAGDKVTLILPIGIQYVSLPDDSQIVAFRYGPEVLAGICDQERMIHVKADAVASELELENEREWGSWRYFFKTVNQDPAI